MERTAPARLAITHVSASRAVIASVAGHALLGMALWSQGGKAPEKARVVDVVELSVVEEAPVPPPPEPVVEPPPPVAAPAVKAAVHPMPVKRAPPPANVPAPVPAEEPPKPVFGVSPESVVEDPTAAPVAVGNTVATAPSNAGPVPIGGNVTSTAVPGAPAGTGSAPFSGVPESFVKQWPRTLEEFLAPYPEEARRVDMRGTVRLRVGIDESGRVREVKVIKRLGYGLDEAASKALWKFRFQPALGQDGRPVPFRINYDYTFTPPS